MFHPLAEGTQNIHGLHTARTRMKLHISCMLEVCGHRVSGPISLLWLTFEFHHTALDTRFRFQSWRGDASEPLEATLANVDSREARRLDAPDLCSCRYIRLDGNCMSMTRFFSPGKVYNTADAVLSPTPWLVLLSLCISLTPPCPWALNTPQ